MYSLYSLVWLESIKCFIDSLFYLDPWHCWYVKMARNHWIVYLYHYNILIISSLQINTFNKSQIKSIYGGSILYKLTGHYEMLMKNTDKMYNMTMKLWNNPIFFKIHDYACFSNNLVNCRISLLPILTVISCIKMSCLFYTFCLYLFVCLFIS